MTSNQALDALYALEMQHEKDELNNVPESQALNITDPDVGKLLYVQAVGAKARSLVEIGAGGGYATIWLGLAAQINGGTLTSYEIDAAKAARAQESVAAAGLSDVVTVVNADAREALRAEHDPLDFVYIDADPEQYETYFDVVYKQLNVGSLLIADRIHENESALEDYVSYMQNHPNLDSVTVPMAHGLEVTVKIE